MIHFIFNMLPLDKRVFKGEMYQHRVINTRFQSKNILNTTDMVVHV